MKKENIAVIISLVSIALAIIILTVFIVNTSNGIGNKFTLEGYIGIMAGFMGACATILVGLQIYNSIEIRNIIAKEKDERKAETNLLQKNLMEGIKEVQSIKTKLSYELAEEEKKRIHSEKETKASVFLCVALSQWPERPLNTYYYMHKTLLLYLDLSKYKSVYLIMIQMDKAVKKIEDTVSNNGTLKETDIALYRKIDTEAINKYPISNLIIEQYKKQHELINSALNSYQP